MTDKPTRRDLMRPAQLLGIAFGAALFAGVVLARRGQLTLHVRMLHHVPLPHIEHRVA